VVFTHGGAQSDLARHLSAVAAKVAKAKEYGIAEQNILPMWGWVGGYSLWSATGLPLMLAISCEHFREMILGAYEMNCHFQTALLK